MSHETEHNHNADLAEQPSLLSREELAELRCPSTSRPRKDGIKPYKARRRDVEERLIQRDGATQLRLPGLVERYGHLGEAEGDDME
jgi:hypothetical protein